MTDNNRGGHIFYFFFPFFFFNLVASAWVTSSVAPTPIKSQSFFSLLYDRGRKKSLGQLCVNNSPLFLQRFIHTHTHTHPPISMLRTSSLLERYDISVSLATNGFITISASASQSHAHAKLVIHTLFFTVAKETDSGVYTCLASSSSGETSWSGVLTVKGKTLPAVIQMHMTSAATTTCKTFLPVGRKKMAVSLSLPFLFF